MMISFYKSLSYIYFRTVRYICGCLQRTVMGKWPHERLVRTRVVSGFIFLRLLCPAILHPRQFNLISGKLILWRLGRYHIASLWFAVFTRRKMRIFPKIWCLNIWAHSCWIWVQGTELDLSEPTFRC